MVPSYMPSPPLAFAELWWVARCRQPHVLIGCKSIYVVFWNVDRNMVYYEVYMEFVMFKGSVPLNARCWRQLARESCCLGALLAESSRWTILNTFKHNAVSLIQWVLTYGIRPHRKHVRQSSCYFYFSDEMRLTRKGGTISKEVPQWIRPGW